MIQLELVDARDAARIVDALLAQAQVECKRKPMLARRYIELSNRLADAMDEPGLPAHAPSSDPLDTAYREDRCCPGAGSMAHVRGCRNHPEVPHPSVANSARITRE
jgi:hypothetical protein